MATNRISIDLVRVNAVLLSAVLWGCVDNPEVNEPKPPPVYVDVVRERARTPSVEVTAMVQAERRAALRAETAGRVIDAPHRAGATVEAGEVLLRLDLSRPEIGVEQARARLAQAESTLRQARRAR